MKTNQQRIGWIIFILLFDGLVTNLALSQFSQSEQLISLQESDELEEMRRASPDRGQWVGFRLGGQANGGELTDRWFLAAMYEWKYSNVFSLPVEIYLFRHRAYAYDQFGQYHKVLETRPILSVSLKARTNLWRVKPYLQAGLEYLSGSGFSLTTPHYGAGIEFFLSERIVLYSNIRKSIVPDYYHFVSLGLNVNVVPFVH
jgi:hypothetical protein